MQPMVTGYTTSVTNSFTPLHSLHRKSRSYSTVYTINTSKPANLLHRRKASKVYTAIVRDLHLTHTHLGSRPFHQLPRPSPLQNLSLPCMPRTYKCPCFTLSQGCQPAKSMVPKTWRQGQPWRYTQLPNILLKNVIPRPQVFHRDARVGKLWRFIFSAWRFKIALGVDCSAIASD